MRIGVAVFSEAMKKFFKANPDDGKNLPMPRYVNCPTKDCTGPEDQFNVVGHEKIDCQKCNKSYCCKCKVLYHEGKSCEDFQKDNFTLIIKQTLFRKQISTVQQCSTCKFWIGLIDGKCEHMDQPETKAKDEEAKEEEAKEEEAKQEEVKQEEAA